MNYRRAHPDPYEIQAWKIVMLGLYAAKASSVPVQDPAADIRKIRMELFGGIVGVGLSLTALRGSPTPSLVARMLEERGGKDWGHPCGGRERVLVGCQCCGEACGPRMGFMNTESMQEGLPPTARK